MERSLVSNVTTRWKSRAAVKWKDLNGCVPLVLLCTAMNYGI